MSKQIITDYKKCLTDALAILGMIATFIPVSECISSPWEKMGAIFVFLMIVLVITMVYRKWIKKSFLVWKKGTIEIRIKKGNILKCNRKRNKKKIIVICVNNDFDMEVEGPGKQSLISPLSLHGQWVMFFMQKYKKSLDELNWMVEKAIKDNDNVMRTKRCLSLEEKPRGNLYRYSKGSIIAIKGKENDNLVFFLFALNEFDNNNHNKEMRKDELKILLHKLIDFCNENSQGYDIEMPIVSTVFAIPKLTASQSVELIMSSLFEKIDMVKSNYTIVVPNDCFDEIKQNIKE